MPKKITELDAIAAVADADVIAIVDDVAGTPTTMKATITQVKAQVLASPVMTGNASVAGTSTLTGKVTCGGELEVDGALNHDGASVGFYGTAPAAKPEVTGARDETEGALASLLTALATLGLITDSTTAS